MELGKLIIEKLSQYNFLTNILPGTVLCILLHYLVGYKLMLENSYLSGILFYFVGMINGRFSSLVVEPLLKKTKVIVFAPYKNFVLAEKEDAKITQLSQENNTYRSYVSVMIVTLAAYVYKYTLAEYSFFQQNGIFILFALLVLLFIFSYRKQTEYVKRRVDTAIEIIKKRSK